MSASVPAGIGTYSRESALTSLARIDPDHAESEAGRILADPANAHLLRCVFADTFTHVFPGDHAGYPADRFFADLNAELAESPEFHLWVNIPLCRYRESPAVLRPSGRG